MDGCDVPQEGELAAAAGTGVRPGFGQSGFRFGIGSEMEADGLQGAARGGTHEPVVTHTCEAFGQDVDQPTAYEFVRREGEDAGFPGVAACPVETDVAAFVITDEPMWADGAAFDVTGEITNGGVAAPGVLKLHVPCFAGQESRFRFWGKVCKNFRVLVLKGLAHEVSESRGEGRVVNEEVFAFGEDEKLVVRQPGECGNDAVDVRMVLELASPGVEDTGEARHAALGPGRDDIAQGVGALPEDAAVEFLGMGETGLAQLGRQRESHHEIRHR